MLEEHDVLVRKASSNRRRCISLSSMQRSARNRFLCSGWKPETTMEKKREAAGNGGEVKLAIVYTMIEVRVVRQMKEGGRRSRRDDR